MGSGRTGVKCPRTVKLTTICNLTGVISRIRGLERGNRWDSECMISAIVIFLATDSRPSPRTWCLIASSERVSDGVCCGTAPLKVARVTREGHWEASRE